MITYGETTTSTTKSTQTSPRPKTKGYDAADWCLAPAVPAIRIQRKS